MTYYLDETLGERLLEHVTEGLTLFFAAILFPLWGPFCLLGCVCKRLRDRR